MAGISTRLVLRSVRVGSTRFAAVAKPNKSPLHLPNQKPQFSLISRSPQINKYKYVCRFIKILIFDIYIWNCDYCRMPVEMSSAVMRTMLPFHTATASVSLTSMLSVSPRFYIWTLEGVILF